MKTMTVIEADLDVGAQGLRSLLSADIAGEPVLRRTVSRATAATLPEGCVVLVRSPEAQRTVASMLEGLPAEVRVDPGEDVPQRAILRASRRWARNSLRGGIGGTTAFDEEDTPARMLALARDTACDALVKIPAAGALIDPGTIDGLLRWVVEEGASLEFYFANLPPGLTCALYSVSVLEKLVAERTTIYQALIYHAGRDERDPTEGKACYPGDDFLRMTPWRLSADSPRTLERLRAVYHDDTTEAVRRLKNSPEVWAGRLPEEVEIEIAGAPDESDPYAALAGAVEMTELMDVQAFTAALPELGAAGDVNLTLGGLGDPLAHPGVFEFIAAARGAGVCGLHLATSGRWLDEDKVDRLAEADLDVVSVRLWGNTPETWKRQTGRDDFDRVTRLVEELIRRRRDRGRSLPCVIVEMMKTVESVGEVEGFFDRWHGVADGSVIRGYNNFAGQIADRDVLHPYPGVRFPCVQLFRRMTVTAKGDARVCGQDIRGKRILGNVFEQGFERIWHGADLERMRAGHVAGDYDVFDLCPTCRHWYQL